MSRAPSIPEKHENILPPEFDREVLISLLQTPPGEDYFSAHAAALKSAMSVDAVVIAEWKKEPGRLLVQGQSPANLYPEGMSFPLADSPFERIVEKGANAYETNLQVCFPRFASRHRKDFSHFIGHPLIGSLGEVVGVVAAFHRHHLPLPNNILGTLRLTGPNTVRELERRQAEEFLLDSARSVDALTSSLKEIHRLTSTPFETLNQLLAEYIRTGAELLQMTHGVLLRHEDGQTRVAFASEEAASLMTSAMIDSDSLPGRLLAQDPGLSEFTVWSRTDNRRAGGIVRLIAAPVSLDAEVFGMLVFFSEEERDLAVEEHYREVIELMARSIGTEIGRRQALDTIQSIKKQQDGDYYLTSLLVKPLARYNVQSENIRIDFILKQKKEFVFREKTQEIGGDICIAHTVRLRNRNYLVFINADAMGKSIQGAGGTLVLGAVFESIMERTRTSESYRQLAPEHWLANAFKELNGIFLSFEYSMLVSLIIGLVDDESGVFYFLNAEHPAPVLWRDAKASFLHAGHSYAKIGAIDPGTRIGVDVFKLLPGDVLYAGSDGKDDILIRRDGDAERSSDPALFLNHVQSAKGDLKQLVEQIQQTGDLTDDLSILKVEVHRTLTGRNHPAGFEVARLFLKYKQARRAGDILQASIFLREAYIFHRKNARVLRELALLFLHQGNKEKAVQAFDSFLICAEEFEASLQEGAHFFRRAGDMRRAIDCAERVRLRNPLNVRSLSHLLLMHFRMGHEEAAEELRQELERVAPDSAFLRRINIAMTGFDI